MAAKHMADWGASVTLLEPPEGSPLRNAPPYYETDGKRRSATWEWLSRGKTAVRLTDDAAWEACARADVVFVESEMASSVLGRHHVRADHAFRYRRAVCGLRGQ